jgi:hypothetical protein
MRKLTLIAVAGASAFALAGASPAGAAGNPTSASCEGAFASLAGTYAPGTVATLTHMLQADAQAADVPVGILNREFAQTQGLCV